MTVEQLLIAILTTAIAAPVAVRVGCVVSKVSRSKWGCAFRFQGFAAGYALLGAMTGQTVIDVWMAEPVSAIRIGFIAASALLVIFDPREPRYDS